MSILKVVFVIIGTLIGAGFASGQEIYVFFFSYGIKGIAGIIISNILMGIVIYKTLKIINKNEIKTYKEFLDAIIPNSQMQSLKKIINIIINLFILITFFIMIAGFGAYFEQEFGIDSIIGSIVLAIGTFIILMTSVKGVVKVNEILVPILITFLIIIGTISIKEIHILNLGKYITQTNNSSFILSAILYSSYNSILLIPVLLTLKKYLKNHKQIVSISIITTIIITTIALIIYLLLVKVDVDITKLEMPAVYVVSHINKTIKYIYGFIILGSIFTTTISLGTSFLQNIQKQNRKYTQAAITICTLAVLFSGIGFSNLINSLYPIFGYLGLIQILRLIVSG